MPNCASYGPHSRQGGARGFVGRFSAGVKKKIGKTKKLGKWVNGYDGKLTGKYIDWRKTRRKMVSASRSKNWQGARK